MILLPFDLHRNFTAFRPDSVSSIFRVEHQQRLKKYTVEDNAAEGFALLAIKQLYCPLFCCVSLLEYV